MGQVANNLRPIVSIRLSERNHQIRHQEEFAMEVVLIAIMRLRDGKLAREHIF